MRWFFLFLFWCCVFWATDALLGGVGLSSALESLFYLLIIFAVYIWIAVFTKRTEIITVASKAILVKKFAKLKLIKSSDGRIFINNNDWLIKWNSKDLDRKLKEGHKYKITSYSYGFGDERIILYAHEIKTSVRKKTGKKSK